MAQSRQSSKGKGTCRSITKPHPDPATNLANGSLAAGLSNISPKLSARERPDISPCLPVLAPPKITEHKRTTPLQQFGLSVGNAEA